MTSALFAELWHVAAFDGCVDFVSQAAILTCCSENRTSWAMSEKAHKKTDTSIFTENRPLPNYIDRNGPLDSANNVSSPLLLLVLLLSYQMTIVVSWHLS